MRRSFSGRSGALPVSYTHLDVYKRQLINDLLDFSKIETDKLELEMLDFDLRDMLEDTVQVLSLRAHEKNLGLVCRVAPSVYSLLRGDPGRLRQILVHLGNNAIKFTAKGEIAVEVTRLSETHQQLKARFEVRDPGIGIADDKIDLLFRACLLYTSRCV